MLPVSLCHTANGLAGPPSGWQWWWPCCSAGQRLLCRDIPEQCPQSIADLVHQMMDHDPMKRPSAKEVVNAIEATLEPDMEKIDSMVFSNLATIPATTV